MSRSARRNVNGVPSEHDEQCWLFVWAEGLRLLYPDLNLMYAIPNGGLRNLVVAKKLKAEGVKRGVPDVHLPVKSHCGKYIGLYIEMKAKGGRVRKEQKEWLEALAAAGHQTAVCWCWGEARIEIERYLNIT